MYEGSYLCHVAFEALLFPTHKKYFFCRKLGMNLRHDFGCSLRNCNGRGKSRETWCSCGCVLGICPRLFGLQPVYLYLVGSDWRSISCASSCSQLSSNRKALSLPLKHHEVCVFKANLRYVWAELSTVIKPSFLCSVMLRSLTEPPLRMWRAPHFSLVYTPTLSYIQGSPACQ